MTAFLSAVRHSVDGGNLEPPNMAFTQKNPVSVFQGSLVVQDFLYYCCSPASMFPRSSVPRLGAKEGSHWTARPSSLGRGLPFFA